MEHLVKLLTLTLLICSCGANMDYVLKEGGRDSASLTKSFRGIELKITGTADSEVIEISEKEKRTTVLIFAQEYCESCNQETEMFISHLKDPTANPDAVNVITILVGAIVEDALFWKEIWEVPWRVGIDPDLELFNQFCPKQTVPCLIVNDPVEGVTLRHHGIIEFDKLLEYTGPWEN